MTEALDSIPPGLAILYGGNRIARVSDALAAAFGPGDRLLIDDTTGDVLHVPVAESNVVGDVVDSARHAFADLASCDDDQISAFYDAFAKRLADDAAFEPIAAANAEDVTAARERGRSTTRLALNDGMRRSMIEGLGAWRDNGDRRDALIERVEHQGFSVEQRRAPLGVVGFVFEGRPNVFADATGVVRTGNTVVFRIGSDALGTARAIVAHALSPALAEAGLPPGTVGLVDSASRASGWALFSNRGISLAVARGSGSAVAQLGAVARQSGIPVSLHGTGGAWLVAGAAAEASSVRSAVVHSLDRKVCNTLNVAAVPRSRAAELVPVVLDAVSAAGERRGFPAKVHVALGSDTHVPASWFTEHISVARAHGTVEETRAETIPVDRLGREWEWEDSPEVSLVVADDLDHAIELFNRYAPRLVASLVSEDPDEHEQFWSRLDAPFVGNGFTRWVDGQFALGRPELGLSNWEAGRLFARSAVLSGDSVFTVRTRATVSDPDLHR